MSLGTIQRSTRLRPTTPFEIERRAFFSSSRPPKLRRISQFAEDEITLPDSGPYAGRKYRMSYQPSSRLWFQGIESGLFNWHAATGPSQTGKSLSCFVIPIMFHVFEMQETVIMFAPTMEICEEKWLIDIRPTIEKSRYAEYLPRSGKGSQGGFSELITFGNGTRLKCMTGGGGDKNKAHFSSRVMVGTEVDGMDEASETSRESDPITQIWARGRAHGGRAIMYIECTVSLETGRIWREVTGGTDSRIVLPCPHCDRWVTLEREHFVGWETAETELQAERLGKFYCSECGTEWSPEQRKSANSQCRLIHKGQRIDASTGEIVGPVPETRTFGFRWSAVNNMFSDESQIGREEWIAARNPDRDAAEKERCQFVWCLPFTGETTGIEIDEKMVASRLTGLPRGVIPNDVETLVVQVDLHLRWHYWCVVATSPNDVRSVVDYGIHLTPNPDINGPEEAIRLGLEQLAAELDGRRWKKEDGSDHELDGRFVDAGYQQDVALKFVGGHPRWRLTKGQGKEFKQPKYRTADVRPGNHWYDSRQPGCDASNRRKWWLIIAETSYWMRQVHGSFVAKTFGDDGARRGGSIALFGSDPIIHQTSIDKSVSRSSFATQILGWKWSETTTPKGGAVMDWVSQWKEDHWFDTLYGCFVGDLVVRSTNPKFRQAPQRSESQQQQKPIVTSPRHFRLFSDGERPRLS